jgi:hypothetical protein
MESLQIRAFLLAENSDIPLLSSWGETLISRELKQRKFVDFPNLAEEG